MSEPSPSSTPDPAPASPPPDPMVADRQTLLFLDMVAQQTNLALIFLGEVPHPETGKRVRELNAARIFIDQLEMLEAKTRGNLNKREESLLKQSLMAARMAFVSAARGEPAGDAGKPGPSQTPAPGKETSGSAPSAAVPTPEASSPAAASPETPPAADSPEEERKKF